MNARLEEVRQPIAGHCNGRCCFSQYQIDAPEQTRRTASTGRSGDLTALEVPFGL